MDVRKDEDVIRRIDFAIVGAGWRAEFFLRIANRLPERFRVTGILIRERAKGHAFTKRWGIPAYETLDELVKQADPSFIVVSVPRSVAPDVALKIADLNLPVLMETPPAGDLEGLVKFYQAAKARDAKIQVAEQ